MGRIVLRDKGSRWLRAAAIAATSLAGMGAAAGGFVGCGGDDAARNDGASEAGTADGSAVDAVARDALAPDAPFEASASEASVSEASADASPPDGFWPDVACPAPTFSPAPGPIAYNANIVIAAPGLPSPTDTPRGYIFFTTDGTLPGRKSPAYDGGTTGVPLGGHSRFRAISSTLDATCVDSAVVEALYFPSIIPPSVPPTFQPAGAMATQENDFVARIVASNSGDILCYATGSGVPACSLNDAGGACGPGSTTYTGPIPISATSPQTAPGQVTIQAVECDAVGSSPVGSQVYTLRAGTPTMSPAPGDWPATTMGSFADDTSGAVVHYTTDGTTPSCTSGTTYSAPFALSTGTYNAVACKTGYEASAGAGPFAIRVR